MKYRHHHNSAAEDACLVLVWIVGVMLAAVALISIFMVLLWAVKSLASLLGLG
jgi:hypothetical protein